MRSWIAEIAVAAVGGSVCGVLVVMLTISHASLIFSPKIPELFAIGFQMAMLSSIVLGATVALLSSTQGAIAFTQDVTAVSISVLFAAILAAMPSGLLSPQAIPTLLAGVVCATFATGLLFYVIGRLNLGKLIRFTPVPVIGGFLAATGCLIVKGAIGLLLPEIQAYSQIAQHLDPASLIRFTVAIGLTLLIITAVWRSSGLFVLPAILLLAVACFHATRIVLGIPLSDLVDSHWVAAPVADLELSPVLMRIDVALVDWSAVLAQFPLIVSVLAVGTIALLMNSSALELSLNCDVDFDRELRAEGAGNMLAALIGGLPGHISLSRTLLNRRLGGRSRLSGLIAASVVAAVLFAGPAALQIVPLPVLAGVLLWSGTVLLTEWLYRVWFRISVTEYLIVLLIVIMVVFVGMLEGVFTGLIAGIVLFVIDYSRIEVIKTQLTGRHFNSRREMPTGWRQAMQEHGGEIVILKLQGFIFFGTAHQLVERIRVRLERPDQAKVRYLVMDFRHTSGLDSSAVLSFIKLERMARDKRFKVVLTNLSADAHSLLMRGGLKPDEATQVRIFDDLDRGLQWCEDKLICRVAPDLAALDSVPVRSSLMDAGRGDRVVEAMLSYMQRRDIEPGDVLIEQGATSNEMYFIESGTYVVMLNRGDGESLRLSTFMPGAVAGEIAFYMGRERTASVVCEEPGVVWQLTRASMDAMKSTDPETAYFFQERMASMLAERLIGTTRLVQQLAD